MDLMAIRRGLMAQMAKGKDFVTGTFTAPSELGSKKIEFGKKINRYLFIIEADDSSKTSIMNSAETGQKGFAYIGVYPNRVINNTDVAANTEVMRVVPSTGVASSTTTQGFTLTDEYIQVIVRDIATNNTTAFYYGLTYKYTIVSLD